MMGEMREAEGGGGEGGGAREAEPHLDALEGIGKVRVRVGRRGRPCPKYTHTLYALASTVWRLAC